MYRVSLSAFTLTLLLLSTAVPSHAQSPSAEAQLQTFATCVGRFSAAVEYEWDLSGTVSDTTRARRDAIVEIVAAILPEDRHRDALNWRNSAKQAQWRLLARARLATDSADAAWAASQAKRFEQECAALLTL